MRTITVTIEEHRIYEISGAKTDAEACDIAKQRAEANSPLNLTDTQRNTTTARVVVVLDPE